MSLALLEAAADPARPWTFAFIGITFAAYLAIGWRSRVRETRGFYVAGQGVPAIANGAATAAALWALRRKGTPSAARARGNVEGN